MEDNRGVIRGKCQFGFSCLCDAYKPVFSTSLKCVCGHFPTQHEKMLSRPGTQRSSSGCSYEASRSDSHPKDVHYSSSGAEHHQDYHNYSSHLHGHHGSHHHGTLSSTYSAGHPTSGSPRSKCKGCGSDAYYDREIQKCFEYCSRNCRDRYGSLLSDNVCKTRDDIRRMEKSLVSAGIPNLPEPNSGHDCRSIGTRIYSHLKSDKKVKSTPPISGKSAPLSSRSNSNPTVKSESTGTKPTSYSGAVRSNKEWKSTQKTVNSRVCKKEGEESGLFCSKYFHPTGEGCYITGYKRGSPVETLFCNGTIKLLDTVVEVNGTELVKPEEFEKNIHQCRSVKFKIHVQDDHIDPRRPVPSDVTHLFALKCSRERNEIGIELFQHNNRVKSVAHGTVAEGSGIKPKDRILIFIVMPSPQVSKSPVCIEDYTSSNFNEALKSAFKEVVSSLCTIVLFINR